MHFFLLLQRLSAPFRQTKDWGPDEVEKRREVAPHNVQYGFVIDPWNPYTDTQGAALVSHENATNESLGHNTPL